MPRSANGSMAFECVAVCTRVCVYVCVCVSLMYVCYVHIGHLGINLIKSGISVGFSYRVFLERVKLIPGIA